jgi:hypothetical protein
VSGADVVLIGCVILRAGAARRRCEVIDKSPANVRFWPRATPLKIHDAALTEYLGQAASAFSRWSLKSSSTSLLRDCYDGTLVMARQKIGFLSQQPGREAAQA